MSFVSTLCFSYTFALRTGLSGIFLRPRFTVTLELHFKSKGLLRAYNTSLCIIFLEPTVRDWCFRVLSQSLVIFHSHCQLCILLCIHTVFPSHQNHLPHSSGHSSAPYP